MNKERKGWTFKNGYWVKNRGVKHSHNLEFFCPACNKITGTVDDTYLEEYGFCWECFTMHVDERSEPTIDVEYYKNLKESRKNRDF